MVSWTVLAPFATLQVTGFFAAMLGARTSAPVSTTAIVIVLAACCTHAGTRSACTAVHCHSGTASPAVNGIGASAWTRGTTRWAKRIPGRERSARSARAFGTRTSAVRSAEMRETTRRPCSAAGVRYPTETTRSAVAIGTTHNAATVTATQLTPFPNCPTSLGST